MSEFSKHLDTLSPRKRELFELLRNEKRRSAANATSQRIPARQKSEPAPLSYAQQRVWFLDQFAPGSPVYNICFAQRVTGELNISAFEASLNEIVRRHEILRTTFAVEGGQPVQKVSAAQASRLPVVDLRGLGNVEREAHLRRIAAEEARRPFDLRRDRLLRAILVRLDAQENAMLLTMHHIASDGWSVGVFMRELERLYAAYAYGRNAGLEALPIQYADYAQWERQWLQGEALEAQLSYWKEQLADLPPALQLPVQGPRPAELNFKGAMVACTIAKEVEQGLKEITREKGSTLFMALLAAFQILLHRYTGESRIPTGTPMANRRWPQTESLIGFFANTLVLCTDLSGNPTYNQALERVRQVTLGAFAHQDLPFEKLVQELHPERNLNQTPLFQVMFALQNANPHVPEFAGLKLRHLELGGTTAKFDLTMTMIEEPHRLISLLEYNTDLLTSGMATRMLDHFQTLLAAAVAHPEQRITDLPLLTEAERRQLIDGWVNPQGDYPPDLCLHHLFEAQARRTPDAVALNFADQSLSYEMLDRRANRLANHLRALGAGPESLIGILMERSHDLVVGLLGILKAGAAYVPLDPAYPMQRLAFILKDARVQLLLTEAHLLEQVPEQGLQVIAVNGEWERIAQAGDANPAAGVRPGNLAYVIYTSGSTGQPKGVQVSHGSVVNFLASMTWRPGLTQPDVLLSVTTICFDIAALEIYLPLSVGARVVIASRQVAADAVRLAVELQRSQATVLQATPATWQMLYDGGWQGDYRLKVLCGGEALSTELAARLIDDSASVWNMYGPTETTIWSAALELKSRNLPVPIGGPLFNTGLHVLDANLYPVPVGVPGQVYISGAGVARGYLGRPALTAERFLPHPFGQAPAERIYHTGDLARYQEDGTIEYLGRTDDQVKIRGYRIELGDVEAALRQHPAVRAAVVVARDGAAGEKQLVAYVTVDASDRAAVNRLRDHLKERLPAYMVPARVVILDAMPLTPNGKVNRKALPAPGPASDEPGADFIPPRIPIERAVATIWSEILRTERISVADSFFDMGGHSLLVTQVVSRVKETFDVALSLRRFFTAPTLAGLAVTIVQKQAEQVDEAELDLMIDEIEGLSDREVMAELSECDYRVAPAGAA